MEDLDDLVSVLSPTVLSDLVGAALTDPFALTDPVSLDSSSTAIVRVRRADVTK